MSDTQELANSQNGEDTPIITQSTFDRKKKQQTKTSRIFFVVTIIFLVILLVLIAIGIVFLTLLSHTKKNAILMIPDGYGPPAMTLTRVLSKKKKLLIDDYLIGKAITWSSDSWVTDSAASATAYASGVKTYNAAVGLDHNHQIMENILEKLKKEGYVVGLVATSRITHATPACFSSHSVHRDLENSIAEQQITKKIDLILGGGLRHFIPQSMNGSKREDDLDLIEKAKNLGYTFIGTREELENLTENGSEKPLELPLLGLFANSHFYFKLDQPEAQTQPSLESMTKIAIELLEKEVSKQNAPGFFLMIEGSRIDHAGHSNDAKALAEEALDFDNSWGIAKEFAEKQKSTLLISVADHCTGGISLGRRVQDESLKHLSYAWWPERVNRVNGSCEKIWREVKTGRRPRDAVMEFTGLNISQEVDDKLWSIKDDDPNYEFLGIVAKLSGTNANVNWATTGHTGAEVSIHALGPHSEKLKGVVENIYINTVLCDYFGVKLNNSHAQVFDVPIWPPTQTKKEEL